MWALESMGVHGAAQFDFLAWFNADQFTALAVCLKGGPGFEDPPKGISVGSWAIDLGRGRTYESSQRNVVGQAGRVIDVGMGEQEAIRPLCAWGTAPDVQAEVETWQVVAGLNAPRRDCVDVMAGDAKLLLEHPSCMARGSLQVLVVSSKDNVWGGHKIH